VDIDATVVAAIGDCEQDGILLALDLVL